MFVKVLGEFPTTLQSKTGFGIHEDLGRQNPSNDITPPPPHPAQSQPVWNTLTSFTSLKVPTYSSLFLPHMQTYRSSSQNISSLNLFVSGSGFNSMTMLMLPCCSGISNEQSPFFNKIYIYIQLQTCLSFPSHTLNRFYLPTFDYFLWEMWVNNHTMSIWDCHVSHEKNSPFHSTGCLIGFQWFVNIPI